MYIKPDKMMENKKIIRKIFNIFFILYSTDTRHKLNFSRGNHDDDEM